MGDRISIQFEKDGEKSPVFFSHSDGMELKLSVDDYYKKLQELREIHNDAFPLTRLNPSTVMVDFIFQYVKESYLIGNYNNVLMNYYITCDECEGDNSDNGHWILNLKTGEWKNIKTEW